MDVNNQQEYYNDKSIKDNILYCTNNGTIQKIEYTDYDDAQGLPADKNTENDNCENDNCYPTTDVVENKQKLVPRKSANLVKKAVGRRYVVKGEEGDEE